MAQILVRDLPEATVRKLKKQARAQGRSLQAEAKRILQEAASADPAASWAQVDRIHEALGRTGRRFSDSARTLRTQRERR